MTADIDRLSALCELMGVLSMQADDAVGCIPEDSPVYHDVRLAGIYLQEAFDEALYAFRIAKMRLQAIECEGFPLDEPGCTHHHRTREVSA